MLNLIIKGSWDMCYRKNVNICYSCVSQNPFLSVSSELTFLNISLYIIYIIYIIYILIYIFEYIFIYLVNILVYSKTLKID